MIDLKCPRCGSEYQVPEARAGQKGKCRCGELIQVPSPAAENHAEPVRSASESSEHQADNGIDVERFYLSDSQARRFPGLADDPVGEYAAIVHDCPFCGKTASRGRYLIWIASKCVEKGEATFPCLSCGQLVKAPPTIFAQGRLEAMTGIIEAYRAGKSPYWRVEVGKLSPAELLATDWGRSLLAANDKGPVAAESLPWDGKGTCPACDSSGPADVSEEFDCPSCGGRMWVNHMELSHTGTTYVQCRTCKHCAAFPWTVWCPLCDRSLLPHGAVDNLMREATAAAGGPQAPRSAPAVTYSRADPRTRFADRADGTVVDTQTGLMWQKQDDGVKRTLRESDKYCRRLTLGGFADWRLPTIDELRSVSAHWNAVFQDTKTDDPYWSSIILANPSPQAMPSQEYAAKVMFSDGDINQYFIHYHYYTRAVRHCGSSGALGSV